VSGTDHHPGAVALRRACVLSDESLQVRRQSHKQPVVRASQMLAQGLQGF
jgi:hypothetical protein